MKRYRLGSEHGPPLDAFHHNEVCAVYHDCVFSYKTCAEIVGGELLVGVRSRLFRPGLQNFPHTMIQRLGSVCPHDTVDVSTEQLWKTVQCKIAHHVLEEAQCKRCRGLKHCRFCWTEYCTEIVNHGADGVELVLDIWKNLGSGRSPEDPKWQKQSRLQWACKHNKEAEYTHGSLRSTLGSFEESISVPFIKRPSFDLVFDGKKQTYRERNSGRGTFMWKDERWQALPAQCPRDVLVEARREQSRPHQVAPAKSVYYLNKRRTALTMNVK